MKKDRFNTICQAYESKINELIKKNDISNTQKEILAFYENIKTICTKELNELLSTRGLLQKTKKYNELIDKSFPQGIDFQTDFTKNELIVNTNSFQERYTMIDISSVIPRDVKKLSAEFFLITGYISQSKIFSTYQIVHSIILSED